MVQLYALVSCIYAYHRWYWFGEKTERNWWNECEDNSNSNSNTADRPTSRESTSLGKEIQGAQTHTIGASYIPAAKNTDGVHTRHTRHTRPNQTKPNNLASCVYYLWYAFLFEAVSLALLNRSHRLLFYCFLFLVCIIIISLVFFFSR